MKLTQRKWVKSGGFFDEAVELKAPFHGFFGPAICADHLFNFLSHQGGILGIRDDVVQQHCGCDGCCVDRSHVQSKQPGSDVFWTWVRSRSGVLEEPGEVVVLNNASQ